MGVLAAAAVCVGGVGVAAPPSPPPVSVQNMDPVSGPTTGGTEVTLSGVDLGQYSDISTGADHTLAVGPEGEVYAWGGNSRGQLGTGNTDSSLIPVPVAVPTGVEIVAVSAGSWFSVALSEAGDVYAWGFGEEGQLGNGTTEMKRLPTLVAKPAGVQFVEVSAGGEHVLARTNDGRIYVWGSNRNGQLGVGESVVNLTTPTALLFPDLSGFKQVSAGDAFSLALSQTGVIVGWGLNNHGQLGDGTTETRYLPVHAAGPDAQVDMISAGVTHALAWSPALGLLAWGDNSRFQLGNHSDEPASKPQAVPQFSMAFGNQEVKSLAAGGNPNIPYYFSSVIVSLQGGPDTIWVWGTYYDNPTTQPVTPTAFELPGYAEGPSLLSGGWNLLALSTNGTAFGMGLNESGQLGDGTSAVSETLSAVKWPQVEILFENQDYLGGSVAQDQENRTIGVWTPAHPAGTVPVYIVPKGDSGLGKQVGEFTFKQPLTLNVTRLSGKDRYQTNLAVNKAHLGKGKPVFVATGANFPDALSIGPVVSMLEGGLILTPKNRMPAETVAFLKSRSPSRIYIVGGTGAVSEAVANQLKAVAPVERVSGADRYKTSAAVFQKFFADETVESAFVATGTDFPDALSASAAGGSFRAPVLLVNGRSATTLLPEMLTLLRNRGTSNLHIVGGAGAVNNQIERNLSHGFTVKRFGGADRYQTNLAVNRLVGVPPEDEALEHVWLATGSQFPDALSAAGPAGTPQGRLVLSNGSCIMKPVVSQWLTPESSMVENVTLIGGSGVLGLGVENLQQCK